ncbi:MAG: hypothetical protein OEZ34_06490 [Spirochaetia bacterium]|nr:hypothetical protein [Spirochaetia bacterium]
MQVQEPENKPNIHILNSGRPIFIPEGLHAGHEIFSKVAELTGLSLCEYPMSVVKNLSDPSLSEDLQAFINEKPALFLVPTNLKIKGDLIDLAKDKVFSFASVSTGTDHVDLQNLHQSGIHFVHAPGANSRSVVEYVISSLPLIFPEDQLLRGDLSFGIIGFGRIGSLLAACLDKLNFSYSFYDPFVEGKNKKSLKETLTSDVVTFHVPLTREGDHPTYRMVDQKYLSAIPEGSLIINTARGQIFSEESYFDACKKYTCIMDVFPVEPPSEKMTDIAHMISPHIAGYNYSARAGGTALTAKNFLNLLGLDKNDIPYSPGNYHFYTIDFLEKESRSLKNNPSNFRNRRENYPDRGDFADFLIKHPDQYSGYLKKILDLCTVKS